MFAMYGLISFKVVERLEAMKSMYWFIKSYRLTMLIMQFQYVLLELSKQVTWPSPARPTTGWPLS